MTSTLGGSDRSGLEVAERSEGGSRVPILMLTARDSASDRVEGLDAGPTTWSSPSPTDELLGSTAGARRASAFLLMLLPRR